MSQSVSHCITHYALWISDADIFDEFPKSESFSVAKARFEKFALYMPFCFTQFPTPLDSKFTEYSTSSRGRLAPAELKSGHISAISQGVLPSASRKIIVRDFNQIIRDEQSVGPSGTTFNEILLDEIPLFTAQP